MSVSPPQTPLVLVAVAPMELAFESDPFEEQLRTEDLLAVLWSESAWGVLTPHEFRVQDPRAAPLRGTDLVIRARALGLRAEHLGVLQARASINESHGQATTTGARGGVAFDYEGEIILTLRLVSAQGETLAEIESRRRLDPFADHPSEDARPELREAIREATVALIDSCKGCVEAWPRLDGELRTNPAVVLERAGEQDLRGHDEMERDTELLTVMHYFDPEMPLPECRRLFKLATGFCLLEDAPPLVMGDCVTRADDQPLDGPHPFARALAKGRPLRLEVYTAGATAPRPVTWAPRP